MCGLLDPRFGDDPLAVPVSTAEHESSQLGEVDRPRVDATFHLLDGIALSVNSPRSGELHSYPLPDALLEVAGHGLAGAPLENHAEQDRVVRVVHPALAWRRCESDLLRHNAAQMRMVVGARLVAGNEVVIAPAQPRAQVQKLCDGQLVEALIARRQFGQVLRYGVRFPANRAVIDGDANEE